MLQLNENINQTDLLGRHPLPQAGVQFPSSSPASPTAGEDQRSKLRAAWRKAGTRPFPLWNLGVASAFLVHLREGEGGALNEETEDKSDSTARRCALWRLTFLSLIGLALLLLHGCFLRKLTSLQGSPLALQALTPSQRPSCRPSGFLAEF